MKTKEVRMYEYVGDYVDFILYGDGQDYALVAKVKIDVPKYYKSKGEKVFRNKRYCIYLHEYDCCCGGDDFYNEDNENVRVDLCIKYFKTIYALQFRHWSRKISYDEMTCGLEKVFVKLNLYLKDNKKNKFVFL